MVGDEPHKSHLHHTLRRVVPVLCHDVSGNPFPFTLKTDEATVGAGLFSPFIRLEPRFFPTFGAFQGNEAFNGDSFQ